MMLVMRIRIPELMARRKIKTAYALAKASDKSIPITTAQRLVAAKGNVERVDMKTLDALCSVFNVGPGELLERAKA